MISVLYFIEGAIKIPTVSVSPEDFNTTAMAEFGNYIQKGTELSFLAISAAQVYFCKQIEENIWFLSVMEQIFILFFSSGKDWQNGIHKSPLQQCTLV